MLRLRPYKPCDAETIVSWCRDEETFLRWGGDRFGAFPIPGERMNEKYFRENGDCAEADNFYPMTACDGDDVVGHFIIRYLHGDPRILRFGWVIVDDARRGRRIGQRMLRLGLKAAFEVMQAEKVTIGVYEDNLPGYRCYLSAGFARCGEQPEPAGEKRRIIELALSREDYRAQAEAGGQP